MKGHSYTNPHAVGVLALVHNGHIKRPGPNKRVNSWGGVLSVIYAEVQAIFIMSFNSLDSFLVKSEVDCH